MKVFSVLFFSFISLAPAWAQKSPVETVAHVDLPSYMGKWYEVASIPQSFQKDCVSNTTADYRLLQSGRVEVLNSCQTKSGKRKLAEGRAKVVDGVTNAKLKVTFVKIFAWIFAFGGKYWILDLGDDYSYSVVGDPTRKYAWILGRTPILSSGDLLKAHTTLVRNGYDTCKVLTSIQDGGFVSRKPLCEVVGR